MGVSEALVSQWMACARIAAVIQLEFGVSYHPRQVGHLCQAIRWTPQKPARRARQRDEAAITHWREETWPPLKKGLKPKARRSPAPSWPAVMSAS